MTPSFLIVGAGFSGAVMARELAERLNASVEVVDGRPHIAGNCHTERDSETGVLVHRYGPHIFNTNSERAWSYVQRFAVMRPFVNRAKATIDRGVFSLPVNLHTINQFFKKRFSPAEAAEYIAGLGDRSIAEPRNFEEQALKFLGRDLYEAFFYGYTKKQWGVEPRELPASILKRLPVRFNYDDNYYNTRYQAMPEEGYTALIGRILDHPNISVELGRTMTPSEAINGDHTHVFWTGPIDTFFGNHEGVLRYRTVYWQEERGIGDWIGNALMNYPDAAVPWTRKIEHKHFAPWEHHEKTVVTTEYSKATEAGDTPYYPLALGIDKERFAAYLELAKRLPRVSFMGRLGTYRYLNMDQVILDTLEFSDCVASACEDGSSIPTCPASVGVKS
jgi:UDP-galactopyranose mutase